MIAFRVLGQRMTGASYAEMPHGPQLDNYRELVGSIQAADEKEAEPFTDQEKRIIRRIAKAFPNDQAIYKAVHKEEVFSRIHANHAPKTAPGKNKTQRRMSIALLDFVTPMVFSLTLRVICALYERANMDL